MAIGRTPAELAHPASGAKEKEANPWSCYTVRADDLQTSPQVPDSNQDRAGHVISPVHDLKGSKTEPQKRRIFTR